MTDIKEPINTTSDGTFLSVACENTKKCCWPKVGGLWPPSPPRNYPPGKWNVNSSDSTRVPVEDYMQATTSALNEPICYEVETKASIAGWESIRKMVQVTVTEMEALPLLEICLRCPAPATMRCQQCVSRSYYCQPCFLHNHTKVNIFHVAEIWKVCMYF